MISSTSQTRQTDSKETPFPIVTATSTLFHDQRPFTLESGTAIPRIDVAYETYGTLNSEGTNAILICHALTGNSHAMNHSDCNHAEGQPGWWDGVIGIGKAFDPSVYYIICSNFLGSCYGTTGPTSVNPSTSQQYGASFPDITVRDMVNVQRALVDSLGVTRLFSVAGGSLGGMQTLEWALLFPEFVQSVIPIATAAQHSPWCIALNEIARLSIMNDQHWNSGSYSEQPARGLALARMIAMISYRSSNSFLGKFGRNQSDPHKKAFHDLFQEEPCNFEVEQYLRYQGMKLVDRFDANSYVTITRAMDSHDVARSRSSRDAALASIRAETLCVGITSDILYPTSEQQAIAAAIPSAQYREIASIHGHDAFLIEFEQLNRIVKDFFSSFSH